MKNKRIFSPKKKLLFIYRTPRKNIYEDWQRGKSPDSLLFGFNHIKKMGYDVDFFDTAYTPLNIFHPIFYPFEHAIISQIGMGFKLDQALFFLPKLKKYDVIISTADSAGLPILFLKYLRLVDTPVIYMTTGLTGALNNKIDNVVTKFYKKILPMADLILAYSQVEINFFINKINIKENKIRLIHLGADWQYFSHQSKMKKNIISVIGADSGRDYKTLFEAVKNLSVKVELVCHPSNIQGLVQPKNVTVHLNIPAREVLRILKRSIITVIPCLEYYRSAGQLVLLESAAAGLPIVASKILGLTTAFNFQDRKSILYVKPRNVKDLRQKIEHLIGHSKLRVKMGKEASKLVMANYTTRRLAQDLAGFIEKL